MLLKLTLLSSLLPKILAGALGILAICWAITNYRKKNASPKERSRNAPEPGEDLSAQRAALKKLQHQNRTNASYRPYALLLRRFVLPLQFLLGIAAESVDDGSWLTPERARDILEEEIVHAMTTALRQMNAALEDGIITLPPAEVTETGFSDAHLEALSPGELDLQLRTARKELQNTQIFQARKTLMEELSGVYNQLLELVREPDYQHEHLRAVAAQAAQMLERGGIYPLFRGSEALEGCPDAFFESVSEQQLVYPGLFIREDGVLRQMGDYYGTWRNL